jgi:hypothetical protein
VERHSWPLSTRPATLRLGGDWRKSEAGGENDREPDQPHGHLGGGWLAGSLAERRDAHQHAPRANKPSAPISQEVCDFERGGSS